MRCRHSIVVAGLLAAGLAVLPATGGVAVAQGAPGAVSVPWAVSGWVKAHASAARLVAGAKGEGKARSVLAGVEIRLNEGWKTYWRHPGDSGGVPPGFDWSASTNVKSARVLYPVPSRLTDANGVSIGYKKGVVFPVEITAVDPTRPVGLVLQLEYGACREICVPAEARLAAEVPPDMAAVPPEVGAFLSRVPHAGNARKPSDPVLKSASAALAGASPGLTFDIDTQGLGADADLFVEAQGGTYLPMAVKVGAQMGGVQRFHIDLKGVDDIAALKGKALLLTVAGHDTGAELGWTVK